VGTYYRLENHDRRELIFLNGVANVKYEAFHAGSLQMAILAVFLGFSHEIDDERWMGRWKLNRVRLYGDNEPGTDFAPEGEDPNEWPDAGMAFLIDLERRQILKPWLEDIGWDCPYVEIERLLSTRWAQEDAIGPGRALPGPQAAQGPTE
jgi:hypothetical protein